MGGSLKAKSETDKRTGRGRRDTGILPSRVSSIKLVVGFLVSPFGVYPSPRDSPMGGGTSPFSRWGRTVVYKAVTLQLKSRFFNYYLGRGCSVRYRVVEALYDTSKSRRAVTFDREKWQERRRVIEGNRDNTGGRYFVVSVLFDIFLLLSGQRGFDSSGIEEKLESEM